jgi:signal transduction histidine kinase
LEAEQKRILEESVQSCERLLNIVNEMLDFSRIETGNLVLHPKDNDVIMLLERVYRQMKIISDREDIELAVHLPGSPLYLRHDPDRLEQVLVNLISNAIKFTPKGGRITLSAKKTRLDEHEVFAFCVTDTGKGIPPSLMDQIFKEGQPFLRDPLQGNRKKGVGLGLAISKRIVDAHGGRIWAESREGEGAAFHVCLPLTTGLQVTGNLGIHPDEQKTPAGC